MGANVRRVVGAKSLWLSSGKGRWGEMPAACVVAAIALLAFVWAARPAAARPKRRGVDCPRLLRGAKMLDLTGFKSLRQDRGPWANQKMPTQRQRFRNGGCLITSYTMALWFYGVRKKLGRFKEVTPVTLDRFSRGNHRVPLLRKAVDASGDARWKGKLVARKRRGRHGDLLARVQANFRGPEPHPIVAKVCAHRRWMRPPRREWHRGRHYVLIVGVDEEGAPIAFDPGWETQCRKQGGPTPWNQIMKRNRYYLSALYWLEPKGR